MAFSDTVQNEISGVGAGETGQGAKIELSTIDYESGLKIGRFAKIDAGVLSNLDGSATPVIAGVVTRRITDSLENPGVVSEDLPYYLGDPNQTFLRQGLVTVQLSAASGTPTQFGAVYATNEAANVDNGNVSTVDDGTTDAVDAEFIKLMPKTTDIWQIRLK